MHGSAISSIAISTIAVIVVAVIIGLAIASATYAFTLSFEHQVKVVQSTSTSNLYTTTTTCSGYPPGGNCHANYIYTFDVIVNYTGHWSLTYKGFHNTEASGQNSNQNYTGGNFSGSGFYSQSVTLSGDNFHFLILCATAQKLDGSNSTLTLTVIGSNSTSTPFGSTFYCGGVAP